jgi:inorganic triphosphatase YgiF
VLLLVAGDRHAMAREVELKLDLSPEVADVVEAADLLAGEVSEEALRATYFDTSDHDLHRNGLSLRIRRSGNRAIQTVKRGCGAATGLFSRDEWERPVTGAKPFPDPRTPIPDLLGDRFAEFAPLFEVAVQRRGRRMPLDGAEVKVEIDRGEVKAGERREVLCELELELIGGDTRALFELARRIDDVAPARSAAIGCSARNWEAIRRRTCNCIRRWMSPAPSPPSPDPACDSTASTK